MPNIVYIATSLDMLLARKDGSVDWLSVADVGGEDYGYFSFYGPIDIVAMGRSTFEEGVKLAGGKNPYEDKSTVVFSKTGFTYENVITETDPVEFLTSNHGKNIWIVGGGLLIADLLKSNLIDEFIISIIPIILGEGIPMFVNLKDEKKLKFQSSQNYDTGLVQLHYLVEK
ncbi:MAG: dihydrofolate reductase family protein [Candidatus Kariarchaeaceae archaeon]